MKISINLFLNWRNQNNYLNKDYQILHNITFNHWIRSYLGFRISKRNFIFRLFYFSGILKNFIFLFLFYIKILATEVIISHDKVFINKKINDDDLLYNFLSSQKQ